MRVLTFLLLCGVCLGKPLEQIGQNWVATDALGRKLPDYRSAGELRQEKFVALFYWTWHEERHAHYEPVNVSQIIAKHPEAVNDFDNPAWKQVEACRPCHWNEPLFGYYRTTDKWVLRKHAEMLADAGVDVIVFDCTNAPFTWDESFNALADAWLEARKDGVKTPAIAFLCPFGASAGSKEVVEKLWQTIYKTGRAKELWFEWEGKPLIMAYPDNLPDEIKGFFTFRPCQPDYRRGPERPDQWSWLEVYPQHGFAEYEKGKYEMVSAGVAQNATASLAPAAMNDKEQVFGRSYTHKDGFHNEPDAHRYGYNFEEQWSRVFELDPKLVFVTGWNEWVAGRFPNWQGTENAFPDQFCTEYSRDIEPMKGGHADNYYYQLASYIRRFKGVDKPDTDGVFYDHKGDTMHRDHRGYGSRHYTNNTGRNDFTQLKITSANGNLIFQAACAESLIAPAGSNWMLLLIDTDRDKSTGWEGYDFLVNRTRAGGRVSIERNIGGKWQWKTAGVADSTTTDRAIEIKIPRELILPDNAAIDLEFKWADNIKADGDIMDFYISGDVAPSARFNYVYTVTP